jgi:ferredoxin
VPQILCGNEDRTHTDEGVAPYSRGVRVVIDSDKCQGHNRCYALAPELFDVDDYGQSIVLGDGVVAPEQVDLVDKARLAVANCPEYAISIVEEDGR